MVTRSLKGQFCVFSQKHGRYYNVTKNTEEARNSQKYMSIEGVMQDQSLRL